MRKKWIINSLLDIDFYKLTMAQLAFLFFRWIPVVFSFKNRTKKVLISYFIKEKDLRNQLDHVRTIKGISYEEASYLESLKIFRPTFIEFMRGLILPEYHLKKTSNGYEIMFEGFWPEVTFWETICLSIVNELYYQELLKRLSHYERKAVYTEGRRRLQEKIRILKENPDIRLVEFGTRRRFSRAWHGCVLTILAKEVPTQLLGTSNVVLAMRYGLKPIGTFAHEMYMVFSGIFHEDIRGSHNKVLEFWWKLYGKNLSIALTDTYGTSFFFRDMTEEQAKMWVGLRQDSGDPFEFGENAIHFYESKGIDPHEKLIVFSDGLDIEKIVALQNRFRGRIRIAFGWGTNLTNDLGFDAISIVIKTTQADGKGLVKLSDNIAKAIGREEDIERYKKVFGYTSTCYVECRY